MKITFVVDRIIDLNQVNWTESNSDFICTTPGCLAANNQNFGWRYINKEIIADFVNNGYIDLVEKDSYIHKSYSFYVINISNAEHLIDQTFWNYIDEKTLDFLSKTNIPILLFYPLEGTGYLATEVYTGIIDTRNKLNLKNKFFLLSLSYYNDHNFNKFSLSNLSDKLVDFEWVLSTCFFLRYVGKNHLGNSTIDYWMKENKIIKKYDLAQKQYDFLCLNNVPTLNRILLLKTLYNNKALWHNNLISNRFDYNDNAGTQSELTDLIHTEKKYFKNKNYHFLNYEDRYHFLKFDDDLSQFINELFHNPLAPTISLQNDGPPINDVFETDWYDKTVFTLITETYAWRKEYYCNYTMFTEKTIKSIIQKHPFIIFSYNNNHKLCNHLGFKTFEEILGVPKDGELGNITTLERLYNLYLCLQKFDKKKLNVEKIIEYTDYNYNHLITENWYQKQIELLKDSIRPVSNL